MRPYSNFNRAMEPDTISKNGTSLESRMSGGNKKSFWIIFACVAALFFVSCSSSKKMILGEWKIVSPPGSIEKVKTITKDGFRWAYYHNGEIYYSLGGTYSFNGKTYTENIKYCTPNLINYYLGEKTVFDVRFKGNNMYAVGGNKKETYNEVWERMK